MRYLGLDVHSKATVYCLLEARGDNAVSGKVQTSAPQLSELVRRFSDDDDLVVGQEVGGQSHFIHDVVKATGVRILTFSPNQLRVLTSSRKKTNRRDSYWIAKCLQTGMTPHPVYIPDWPIRRLRNMLARRAALVAERRRWLVRARSYLRAGGMMLPRSSGSVERLRERATGKPDGIELYLDEALELCQRRETDLARELREQEDTILKTTRPIDDVHRLMTIPAVGEWVAATIYAWVGDVRRFRNARALTSYAGLVPTVHQSGDSLRLGGITRQGSPALRNVLVQAGQVLLFRCKKEKAGPLWEIAQRVHTTRRRRKVAVVAAARHILRVAYYVLRDGTEYEPARLHVMREEERAAS